MKPEDREIGAPQGMRSFLTVWFGQVISLIGSGLTSFALGVWLYEQTERATPFALTVLLANLPRILLAPLAGSLADRWNRRWMMILADSADALVKLGAVGLVATGHLQIWHVYLIAALSAVCAAFQEPAYTASIVMLVPKKHLARANGLIQTAQAVESLIAPLLAAALMGTVGLRAIFAIDFITYFFAIGALLVVRIPQPKLTESDTGGDRGTVWRDARYGWGYLKARPGLLGLLLYFALVNFLLNGVGVLTGPMVLAFGSPNTLGVVQMASGAGLLLGSVTMSMWGGPQRRIVGVIGAIALAALGGLAMGMRPWAPLVSCGVAWFLFWIPVGAGSSLAIFQSKVGGARGSGPGLCSTEHDIPFYDAAGHAGGRAVGGLRFRPADGCRRSARQHVGRSGRGDRSWARHWADVHTVVAAANRGQCTGVDESAHPDGGRGSAGCNSGPGSCAGSGYRCCGSGAGVGPGSSLCLGSRTPRRTASRRRLRPAARSGCAQSGRQAR